MARKQKLLSQSKGNLTVLDQQAKYIAEKAASDGFEKIQPTPPRYLDKDAKAEYSRIVSLIGDLPIRNLDRAELENYCTWYSIYKRAVKKLNAKSKNLDQVEIEEDKFRTRYEKLVDLGSADKEIVQKLEYLEDKLAQYQHDYNVLVSRINKATVNIKSLASDLGLNVNSRLQMNMPKTTEKDKHKSIKEMFE